MKPWRYWSILALLLSAWPTAPSEAAVFVGVGVGYRPGYYYRPYRGYGYGYGYYPVVPIVIAPAPIVVAPPVVAPPVTVVQPGYAPAGPAPSGLEPPLAPAPMPEQLRAPPVALTPTVARGSNPEIDRCLQQLRNPEPSVRAEAIMDLGRLRASQAIESLQTVLSNDRSPTVREAAARGLGLIGSPSSLNALQLAAQADDDREVRNSARFAAETIRSQQRQP